ncbi:c-type cytochrome biogenesis protein CcmI [Alsobacter sp. SYSU M60028]|uniref:C-type cytochrome biogenesis protein CcmI n=1 Tax=Alsobacter ponti TaxID=2962936 RepID=A0ABT1LAE2_9HYPH|nr:c-type cytochrome biogenesis protein CcmI [Alsobacter ponti]MCP8937730.1 c-type cytochrome biogenesis protein CcmI [Alsobacter ponti]
MFVWIVLALLTGAAVFAVLLPLSRQAPAASAPGETATDAAFYRTQLAEIERDAERGLIDPADAETARVEAARRLLGAARRDKATEHAGGGASLRRRRVAALLALVGIPLLSLPLYLRLGQPDMPSMPLSARVDRARDPGQIDLQEAMARIEAHLAQKPDDGQGHEVIAPVYMNAGRYDDAARAWSNAIRILGETPRRLENYGEALVASNNGIVSADARQAFDSALKIDPATVKARFYRALASEQEGDAQAAIAAYRALASQAPAGSALAATLNARLASLGAPPADTADSPAGAIAAMPEGERMAAIRGMVENLSARLAQDGSDVEGWIRLVRSYAVLGEPDKARDALARGRAALSGDEAGRGRLDSLGRELNIGGS